MNIPVVSKARVRVPWRRLSTLALVLLVAACDAPPPEPPDPDTTGMEGAVGAVVRRAREAVIETPDSATAWGELGMVLHVHELYDDAATSYRQAASLDASDARWPYFLGEVLTIRGDDPEAAFAAFRRALEVRPDYAPAHLRLANALAVEDRLADAEPHYRRALELKPDLVPARLGLGQVLLRQDDAEGAVPLLEAVVREQPANPRALSALGRAYQRVGRRDEALAVAERARGPEVPGFFDDPLMSEVIGKGASTSLLWDRARAYLDAGNFEQAAAGLERVVQRKPDDAEAQHQLGSALQELGRSSEAARHLERAVEIDPSRVDARVQLAVVLMDAGRGDAALGHLQTARAARPDDLELQWLEARALAVAERNAEAVAAFEAAFAAASAAAAAADSASEWSGPPAWALHDWGAALAQLGRYAEAIARFEAVLAAQPDQPQTLFYLGLAYEAVGERDQAVDAYRRTMSIEPNPLAANRLDALEG